MASSAGPITTGRRATRGRRSPVVAVAAIAAALALAGCSTSRSVSTSPSTATAATGTAATGTASSAGTSSAAGSDRETTFTVGGVVVHGSLRLPAGNGPFPGAVLLAGSGPTDRNGDSGLITGSVGTLRHIADLLAARGVASLRYDKLGAGKTGLGPYAKDPGAIDFQLFELEAVAALRTLSDTSGVDRKRLMLIGHSEGGLVALATAATPSLQAPALIGLGLLEPLPIRYLDLIRTQVRAQLQQGVAAGSVTSQQAKRVEDELDAAITSLRTTGAFPAQLPTELQRIGFSPVNARFLRQADALDPATLAKSLPPAVAALQTCSAKDIQVTCDEQQPLRTALDAHGRHTWLALTTADHVLKDVGTGTSNGSEYTAALPFDAEFDNGFQTWLTSLLAANPLRS